MKALAATDSGAWLQQRIDAETAPLRARIAELVWALQRVNEIRNSIIAVQGFNWSEHAYPLVSALDGAGFVGAPYPETRKNIGTIVEQNDALRAQVDALTKQLAAANNDAARAELRARDLGDALHSIAKAWRDGALSESQVARALGASLIVTRRAIDAIDAPDSDARLREVVGRSLRRGYEVASSAGLPNFEALIAEVLEAKS